MGLERRGGRGAGVSQARTRKPPARAVAGGKALRGSAGTRRAQPSAVSSTPRFPSSVPRFRAHLGLWILAKTAACGVLVAGIGVASQIATSKQFHVAEVVIAGNELVAAEDIAATINVGGMNTFAVRGRRLERTLRADPAIESVSVRPRLPNTVEIAVSERAPAVVWETAGRSVLTDAEGLALRDGSRDDLPVVHAPEGPTPDPGGRVDLDTVRMAEALVPRLASEGLAGGQLEYRPSYGATLILADSARLAIGTGDGLEDKLAAYRAIRSYLDQNRTKAQFIDVRFLERPYFR